MTNHDFKSEFCSLFEVNSTTKFIVLALHKENMFTTTSKILFLFLFDVKSTTIIIAQKKPCSDQNEITQQ